MTHETAETCIPAGPLTAFATGVLAAIGCTAAVADEVARHLVDADLRGVASHGVYRLPSYAEEARSGEFVPGAQPVLTRAEGGGPCVDGNNGFGMPALRLGIDTAIAGARRDGTAGVGVAIVGHTGRVGAFAARAAEAGCLAIILGGGSRRDWRQVAPHGGARAMLPTNPYAFAMPGGARGPVVVDFATSAAAAGKVRRAQLAGRSLPPGLCLDAAGRPTTSPDDCFDGGALLPMAGPKGYGMALVAELLGEAIFGEVRSGMNWLCICIDLARFRAPDAYRRAAEACLAELRACPPAEGFGMVEIPGERGARLRAERLAAGVPIDDVTAAALERLGAELGVAWPDRQATNDLI
jgi:LDH2 family malate/lactate/ureidoglycolate dehydrogenase